MMTLLAIILIFSPVFVLVSHWTKLHDKLWVKITNTILSVVFIMWMYGLWHWYDKYETLQKDYIYVDKSADLYWEWMESIVQEFKSYADCVNRSKDNEVLICSINHFKYVVDVLNLYYNEIK